MTSVLQEIAAVATIIIAIAMVVLTGLALAVAWELRASRRKVEQLLGRAHVDFGPILRNAQSVSENVNYVTTAIRADVDKINATIGDANERVQHAVALAEQQLGDFNALLSVVREEAEHLFVSTASTVRGFQRGAQTAFGERGGMDLASDELDAAEAADDMMTQEEGDGHDSGTESAAALPAAPRIRPRSGKRRRA